MMHPVAVWGRLVVGLCLCGSANAFDGSLHQQLTFIAAKQFNRCVAGSQVPRLTPLQVRYIAKANVGQAESNLFRRAVRWGYYDRKGQDEKSLLWFIQTRFHGHFNDTVNALDASDGLGDTYSNLGRIVNYLQDMTSPAHVVPVYTTRWWRLNVSDRFDGFPVDEDAVTSLIGDDCAPIAFGFDNYHALLAATADQTLHAVQTPIPGMPASWEVFWKLNAPGSFGEYGDAGNNFGRPAEFACTEEKRARCVLLDEDPLYESFAVERHADAVRATVAAMRLLQRELQAPEPTP